MNISRRALARDAAPDSGVRSSRARRAGIPVVAAATIALGAGQVALALPSSASTPSSPIAVGHAPVLPKGAKAAAAPAGSATLSLDVELSTPNSAGLQAFAAAVNDPKSSVYHQFLSKGDVAKQFGASAAEIAAVDSALKAAGLTPGPVSADGMFIPVTTTVAQAGKAFGVGFAGYKAAGRTIYANTSAPKFAASIASDVTGVVGLDNIEYATPHYVTTHQAAKAGSAVAGSHASPSSHYSVPSCSNIATVMNGLKLHEGTNYYSDTSLSNIYGLSSLLAGGNNGSGVTVAVFELEGYDAAGVADFDNCYGSSASVSEITVDGGPTAPANLATGVGVESALDIENIANLAPGVHIIDYAGPDANLNTTTTLNVLDTYSKIINDDAAQVVSTSWGLCETDYSSAFRSSEATLFAQAAAQGQTVVAASGDSGSTDCYQSDGTSQLSVDDPASQPNVLGVGGTGMTGLGDTVQSTWNSMQTFNGVNYFGAGGGGVSTVESKPSFQNGVTGTGYSTNCPTASGAGCRQVPDVSALADPNQGYVVEITNNGTEWYQTVGGTSGAAPVWAAIYALADASSACSSHKAGLAAPALYAAGTTSARFSVFRDITAGGNGIAAYGATYGYSAGNGYDMATGWGTPNATGVAAVACQTPVTSAASYFQAIGPVRVLDTRNGTGGTTGPVGVNGTVKLQISGKNGVAASNVTAVVLNVTVANAAAAGIATVWPDGAARPNSSNLNWTANEIVPNLVVVPVGADGAVDIWNGSPSASAQFIADMTGYFTSNSAATGVSTYHATNPVRVLDTRNGTGATQGKIAANKQDSVQIGGTTVSGVSIPSGITAVALNVTVTNPSGGGVATVYPNQDSSGNPVSLPSTSNLNFSAGETIANMVMVPVGADGKVDFYNGSPSGSTDLVADLGGYFTAGTAGAVFHSLGPDRILDTRLGLGEANANPIGAKSAISLAVPTDASAIVANLTITQPKSNGVLTAYPHGTALPTASNLNFVPGQDIPNLAIVQSTGAVDFYNWGTGTTHLIVDIAGYFSAS